MVLSVADAAHRLDVSPARIRQLIHAGGLPATLVGGHYVIDEVQLDRVAGYERLPAVRSFSRRLAWAAASLADGKRPGWISSSELSRLRRRLRETDDSIDAWRTRMKSRAATTLTFRVAVGRVRDMYHWNGALLSGTSARGLVGDRQIETGGATIWLAHADDVRRAVRTFAMLPSSQGNVVVHIAELAGLDFHDFDGPDTTSGDAYRLIVAADLLDNADARAARAGRTLLQSALRDGRRHLGALP